MLSRRLLALLFIASSACVAAVGCSHEVTRPVAQLLDARGGHAIVWFGKGIAEALSSR